MDELHTDCVIDVNLLALRPVKRRLLSDLPKLAPNFEGAKREPPAPGFLISGFEVILMPVGYVASSVYFSSSR